MAITTGQQVKMVQVSTQAKYNDLVGKEASTIYYVVETKKIYLDGVGYGFNGTDVTPDLINSLFSFNDSVSVSQSSSIGSGKIQMVSNLIKKAGDDNILDVDSNGVFVSKATVNGLIDSKVTVVTDRIGALNGIAGLDASGKVPTAQLPSYVDDVLEYVNLAGFPATGEAGKIYVAKDTNKVYRWPGSAPYVEISSTLALGTTSATAFRGDYGNTAYQHSLLVTGNPHGVNKGNVGLNNVENYGLATKVDAEAGSSSVKYMTPLRVKEAIDALAPKMT